MYISSLNFFLRSVQKKGKAKEQKLVLLHCIIFINHRFSLCQFQQVKVWLKLFVTAFLVNNVPNWKDQTYTILYG